MSDFRMTLYEELGLPVSAAPEEIRKAHRTLCRLLHPDQQTDGAVRQAAELQMRRINIIVDILLDPQKRRRYDDSLRGTPPDAPPPFLVTPRVVVRASFSLLDLIGIIVAAVLVTVLVIWLFAGDFMHWRGEFSAWTDAIPDVTREEIARNPPRAVLRLPVHEMARAQKLEPPLLPALALPTMAAPKRLDLQQRKWVTPIVALEPDPPAVGSTAYPSAGMTMPALPVPPITTPPDRVTPPALSFTGLWLLPSSGRKSANPGSVRQSPQYIQMNILRGQDDTLFGEYSARYETPDRAISPEVAFTFEGTVAGKEAAFRWSATDGSRGTVELKLLNPRSMQVAWRVSEFGTSIGVPGGAAVVIRQAN